jgi:hypothetical protein
LLNGVEVVLDVTMQAEAAACSKRNSNVRIAGG